MHYKIKKKRKNIQKFITTKIGDVQSISMPTVYIADTVQVITFTMYIILYAIASFKLIWTY